MGAKGRFPVGAHYPRRRGSAATPPSRPGKPLNRFPDPERADDDTGPARMHPVADADIDALPAGEPFRLLGLLARVPQRPARCPADALVDGHGISTTAPSNAAANARTISSRDAGGIDAGSGSSRQKSLIRPSTSRIFAADSFESSVL